MVQQAKNILSSKSFWILNKFLVLELGLETALFLTDLSFRQDYWESKNKLTEGGFFFIERRRIKEETTLNFTRQYNATRDLVKLDILSVKKMGIPSKNYYRVNVMVLNTYISNLMNKGVR